MQKIIPLLITFLSFIQLVNLDAAFGQYSHDDKKLILTGHDAPDTAQYLASIDAYARLPFDGFEIRLESNQVGIEATQNAIPFRTAFSDVHWDPRWFEKSIDRLATANQQLARETFLKMNSNPGDVDWFDDEGWREITEHLRIAAAAVEQSGSAGLIFDAEPYPYDKPVIPFSYQRQPQRAQHSLFEYEQKARQRGRETMLAMAGECPKLKILSYFFLSYVTTAVTDRGPNVLDGDSIEAGMATHTYNLLVPFMMGWVEAAPATVRIIDGNENSYYYNSEIEYQAAADRVLRQGLALVPLELRNKYREMVQIGHAVYLDNCQPEHSLFNSIAQSSPNQILENRLVWALKTSEQYVWVYAEEGRFLELPKQPETATVTRSFRFEFKHWNEIFPGAIQTIDRIHSSTSHAESLNKLLISDLAAGRAKPIFETGHFGAKVGEKNHWFGWQRDWSHGTLKWNQDDGNFEIAGTAEGVLVRDIAVESGQTIHLTAQVSVVGNGQPFLRLAMLDADKRLLPGVESSIMTASRIEQSTGRMELQGRWIVPARCSVARIIIGAASQGDIDDVLQVHDAQAYWVAPQ